MMNIEGTPNEKALIVIFSYVIGFVSAFIAFNYAVIDIGTNGIEESVSTTQSAAVIGSKNEETTNAAGFAVVYENKGLYLYSDEQSDPVLLSKSILATEMNYSQLTSLEEKQGLHSKLPVFNYFAEAGYVYFCEVYDELNECTPYMYDVERNTLHVIQDAGGPIKVSVNEAMNSTMSTNIGIEIGEYISQDSSRPWVVAVK